MEVGILILIIMLIIGVVIIRISKGEAQLKAGFIVMKSSLSMLVISLILFLIIRYL